MNWIHCNKCHIYDANAFFISQCAHTLCQSCLPSNWNPRGTSPTVCPICNQMTEIIQIEDNLYPEMTKVISPMTDLFEETFRIAQFQIENYNQLIDFLKQKDYKHRELLSRFKDVTKAELDKLRLKCAQLEKENQRLRDALTKQSSSNIHQAYGSPSSARNLHTSPSPVRETVRTPNPPSRLSLNSPLRNQNSLWERSSPSSKETYYENGSSRPSGNPPQRLNTSASAPMRQTWDNNRPIPQNEWRQRYSLQDPSLQSNHVRSRPASTSNGTRGNQSRSSYGYNPPSSSYSGPRTSSGLHRTGSSWM